MVIHPDIPDEEDSDKEGSDKEGSDKEGSDKEGSDNSDIDKSTRDKQQYPVYLDADLRERLNEAYEKYNAHRSLDGKDKVEKNKHFNQALIECALANNWREHVKRRFEETTNRY